MMFLSRVCSHEQIRISQPGDSCWPCELCKVRQCSSGSLFSLEFLPWVFCTFGNMATCIKMGILYIWTNALVWKTIGLSGMMFLGYYLVLDRLYLFIFSLKNQWFFSLQACRAGVWTITPKLAQSWPLFLSAVADEAHNEKATWAVIQQMLLYVPLLNNSY